MARDVGPPSVNRSATEEQDATTLSMILGDYGLQILLAIQRGARSRSVIPVLSGVPRACVEGRLPVLLNLNLVEERASKPHELKLTSHGELLLRELNYF
ncbi:MAG: hypothetical protein Kow0069_32100 [Promethearchaeota archaeon]